MGARKIINQYFSHLPLVPLLRHNLAKITNLDLTTKKMYLPELQIFRIHAGSKQEELNYCLTSLTHLLVIEAAVLVLVLAYIRIALLHVVLSSRTRHVYHTVASVYMTGI